MLRTLTKQKPHLPQALRKSVFARHVDSIAVNPEESTYRSSTLETEPWHIGDKPQRSEGRTRSPQPTSLTSDSLTLPPPSIDRNNLSSPLHSTTRHVFFARRTPLPTLLSPHTRFIQEERRPPIRNRRCDSHYCSPDSCSTECLPAIMEQSNWDEDGAFLVRRNRRLLYNAVYDY